MDETLLRHDLGHMHGDDKWGHLAVPLDDLLDAKDAEIARLKSALASIGEHTDTCVGQDIGRRCRNCQCGGQGLPS